MNLQELLDKSIKEENDARPEKNQRHWFISRLGSCLTGQYLERIGKAPDAPFDERTLRVFKCGNIFEQFIVDLVSESSRDGDHGEGAYFDTQVHVEDNALDISGYVDLVMTMENGAVIPYEIKSKHSKAFWYMLKEGHAQRQHEIQLWWYLKLLNLPLGIIVYVSKDDLTIKEFPVQLNDEEIAGEAQGTLQLLNLAWDTKQVPEPSMKPEDAWKAKYCQFHRQCMKYAPEVV